VKPGAIYGLSGTVLDISDCVIRQNQHIGIYTLGFLELRNSVVLDNGAGGVSAAAAGCIARNNRITGNASTGLYFAGASCEVVADTLSSNGGSGLSCPNLPTEFSDIVSTDNYSWGFYIPAEIVDQVWLAGCVNSANGRGNAIGVSGGSIPATTTWLDEQPYAIQGGNLTVPDDITFTLEPGVIMKFWADRHLIINGTLVAAGAEADSIVFSSYRDDEHGGDTNLDGPSSGSPGDWELLFFENADAGCNLSYCQIRYAGGEYYYDYYNRHYNAICLWGSGTALTMTHSIVESTYYSSTSYEKPGAIYGKSGTSLDISDCLIRDNQRYGIYTDGSLELRNSSISGNATDGARTSTAGAIVRNNRFEENGWSGLYLGGASCEIVADTLLNNNIHGLNLAQVPAEFYDCYAAGNGRCGYVLPTQIVTEAWVSNEAEIGEEIGVLGGNIPAGTTWIDEHPYAIYGDITIPYDHDLVLEPGSILKFGQYYKLTVNGRLFATGNATDWIVFTSYKDDSHGGDTNGDGSSDGTPGDWVHVIFDDTNPTSTMVNCLVRYAGYNHGGYSEAVLVNGSGAELVMVDCIVEETAAQGGTNNALCVYAGASFYMSDTVVRNNAGRGIYVAEPGATITGCLAENNDYYGFMVHPNLVGEVATQDSMNANGWDNSLAIMAGNILEDDAWPNTYLYAVKGSFTVDPGATLILHKGSILKFLGNYSIEVQGGLYAQGDAIDKVVFTSFQDDNYGGDTNGDGVNTIPLPGDWGQIRFNGANPASLLGWTLISYAGAGNAAALEFDDCALEFSECIVHNNLDRGVRVGAAGELVFTNCDIYSNGYGLENLNTLVDTDARGCWWGDPSGPSGVGPGSGDAVSAYVLYDPWLDRSIDNPWVAITSPATEGSYMDVLIFDLDEDPLLDLVAATEGNGLEVYQRCGMECWASWPSPITDGQYLSLAKGDFNLDGHEDLLVCGPAGIRCFAGDGLGGWTEYSNGLVGLSATDVKFDHVDHDLYPDVVACSGDNQGIWAFYGDGLGNWTMASRPTTTGTYNRLAAEDLNNDSWLDIVATNAEYLGIHIWYGAADSTWTATDPIDAGSAFYGLALGDIDKDDNGTFDIAAGSSEASVGISIYLNDGAGGWTPGEGPTTTGRYGDIVLEHLSGDTWLDLAASNLFGGISVWIGTSGGNWNYWYHPSNVNIYNGICVDDFTLNESMDIAGAATIHGIALWDNLTPGAQQEYFDTVPDNLDFGEVAIGFCAFENFQLINVTLEDTLQNVVVYTTHPAFDVTFADREEGPFDMLPGEVVDFEVSFCPTEAGAENELVIIHSTQSVTHVRVMGEGVPYIEPVWAVDIDVANSLGGEGNSQTLTFGAAIGATDSLDAQSGEQELPPTPPAEIFDARFQIPGSNGSLLNIHDVYEITDAFTFQWQPGSEPYPMTVTWNPADLPSGTFLIGSALKDTLDMAQNTEYVVPEGMEYVTELNIWTNVHSTFCHDLNESWQLVSRPIVTADDSLSILFPGALSAFGYQDGYVQAHVLLPGWGYWLDMPLDTTICHTGDQVRQFQLPLPVDWSLVGAPADTFPVADISQVPPDCIQSVYGFDITWGYFLTDTLLPGQGYWMDLSEPCEITVDLDIWGKKVGGGDELAGESTSPSVVWELPITVTPAAEYGSIAQELSIGAATGASAGLDPALGEREAPPKPPRSVFEARLAGEGNGLYRDLRDPTSGSSVYTLSWQGPNEIFPLSLVWDPAELPAGGAATLSDPAGGALLPPVNMRETDHVLIPAELAEVGAILVTVEHGTPGADLPAVLALHHNVPNPFNPNTMIRFDLPRPCGVELAVFDLTGRLVRNLVSGPMEAGRQTIEWDGRDGRGRQVASGVYFSRLKAEDRVLTRKMMLVK